MENKVKVLIIFLSIIALLSAVGCSYQFPPQAEIAVICTSAVDSQSKLIFLQKDGTQLGSIDLRAQGIFEIEQPEKDKLVLPVTYSDKIFHLDLTKKRVKTTKTLKFPIFYKKIADKEFIIFNSDKFDDIDYLTYYLKDNNGEKTLRIKGFPLATTISDMTAYVYMEKNTEPDTILIIDLQTFTITDEFIVNTSLVGIRDLKIIDGQIFIAAAITNKLFRISLQNKSEITSIPLENSAPNLIFENSGSLVITHYDGGISILDSKTHEMRKTITLPYTILNAQVDDEQLFLIVIDHNHDRHRKIVVVDLKTLDIEKIINLEYPFHILPQNLILLK